MTKSSKHSSDILSGLTASIKAVLGLAEHFSVPGAKAVGEALLYLVDAVQVHRLRPLGIQPDNPDEGL
jgi:hypothetical protein